VRDKRVFLEKREGYENLKTIVFDLDETLVHCLDDVEDGKPDAIIPVTFPTGDVIDAGIMIRPYARQSLIEANKNFEVIVFTASHPCYANVVLDHLDPDGTLVHHRLYRDNCL